jgi:1,4-alpha-glucan branching enzyme
MASGLRTAQDAAGFNNYGDARGARTLPTKPGAKAAAKPKTPRPVKVTFTLPAQIEADEVALCGDFNGWSHDEIKLGRDGDGEWRTTIGLLPGHAYRYRYLLDGHRWENAWNADRYDPNPYGGDDSVVVLE